MQKLFTCSEVRFAPIGIRQTSKKHSFFRNLMKMFLEEKPCSDYCATERNVIMPVLGN